MKIQTINVLKKDNIFNRYGDDIQKAISQFEAISENLDVLKYHMIKLDEDHSDEPEFKELALQANSIDFAIDELKALSSTLEDIG